MSSAVSSFRRWRDIAETLAIAGGGGALFTWIGFPAGWLAGAMCGSAAAALAGRKIFLPQWVARPCFVLLGTSLGAVATPETLAGMASWPLSIAIVCVAMVVVTIATITYLRLMHGWDKQTAMFAAIPGGLSQVMAMAAECGADLRAVGIVQTLRLLILAVGIPVGLAAFGLAGPSRPPASAASLLDAPGEFVVLLALSAGLAMALLKVGFPGGLIFGPLVMSAGLHGASLVHVSLPPWLVSVSMVGLGAVTGSRFTGTPVRVLLRFFGAGLGAFVVGASIAASFAVVAGSLMSLRISDVVVAYSPGAVDVMMILALALHLDPVFVGAHHLARMFTVTLALPVAVRWLGVTLKPADDKRPPVTKDDDLDD
jgi:membrane AbrB-like protein